MTTNEKTCPECSEPYEKPAIAGYVESNAILPGQRVSGRGEPIPKCPHCGHVCSMECVHPLEHRIH